MGRWPKLSEQLSGPKRLGVCQNCGLTWKHVKRWQEHDEQDKPTPVVVCLCERCSNKLVEPHPRLYRQLHEWEPMPGSMAVCVGCSHNQGVSCTNPVAQINGGPGLTITYPRPTVAHLCGSRKGGGRFGRTEYIWQGPPSCADREAMVPVSAQ